MRYRWISVFALIVVLIVSLSVASTPAHAATITVLDSPGAVGYYTSVAILNGAPVISYFDATIGDLKVARCGNDACSSGNTLSTVDSTGDVGRFTSLAILNGAPVISYYDVTNGDLKLARC